jgi:hypothetical protein
MHLFATGREFEAVTKVVDIKTMFGDQLENGTGIQVLSIEPLACIALH